LVSRVTGKTFREIADQIASIMGKPNEYQKQHNPEEKQQRDAMTRVWQNSFGPIQDSPVDMYLNMRCGCSWPSPAIRELVLDKGPFMVAKIMGHDDRPVNLHLTALTWYGRKADVTPAKRVMAGKLPDGCAIRLGSSGPVMGVAEGIETAISASIMFDMPVWACVNGTMLSKWVPPDDAEQITVFADNDLNYTGHAKAYQLANRLEVQYKRSVTVKLPPRAGTDWNDHHQDVMDGMHKTQLRVVK
jgi:putative DNA primase/helicase